MADLDYFLSTASSILENGLKIAANAQIIFQEYSEGSTFSEDDVGNPISDSVLETVELDCYLRQGKLPIADVQAGLNLDSEYFKGRLVSPKTFDFPIKAVGEVRITINDREGLLTQLIVLESPTSQQYNIKSYLGQRIACYVQFSQGN